MKDFARRTSGLIDVLYIDQCFSDLALFGVAIEAAEVNIWLRTASNINLARDYLMGSGTAKRSLYPPPDLLLLDWRMLGEEFNVPAWVRSQPWAERPPVLVLSGGETPAESGSGFGLDSTAYLAKPTDFEGWKRLARLVWSMGIKHARGERSRENERSWDQAA